MKNARRNSFALLKPVDVSFMEFHRLIREYFNNGCHDSTDYPWSLVSVARPFRKNAGRIVEAFRSYRCDSSGPSKFLSLQDYDGGDARLVRLREFLKPIEHKLVSVILHGSRSDGRTTGYSDVDALVILKDELFGDPDELMRVSHRLSIARRFMYVIDPLQHHGWFVMTERDLSCFPERVLPLEVLSDSKVLLGMNRFAVTVCGSDPSALKSEALRVLSRLTKMLREGWRPKNCFALKSFLSEFMMIPVLYLQARDSKGWSKRDSFEEARKDFDIDTWGIMDEVSDMRRTWSFAPDGATLFIMQNPAPWADKLRKYWPTPIPSVIRNRIDGFFYHRMLHLLDAVRSRIGASQD